MVKALTPVSEGEYCEVEIDNKIYRRVARYRADVGLYIVINNKEYYEYEFNYDELIRRRHG